MTLSLDSVVSALPDHLASDLPEETIILNLPQGTYFGVEGVAREIWQLVQKPTTVRAVRDELASRYGDTAPDDIERDVLVFLEELRANDLVTVES